MAEERLQVVEERRVLEERKQKFENEARQRAQDQQNLILGKKMATGGKGARFTFFVFYFFYIYFKGTS